MSEGVVPLGQMLIRSARRSPDREALVFPDVRLSYRELADRTWEVARSLTGLGVQPREHVGVLMTNHPDLVATVFGAALIGATVVPINARYRTTELHSIVEDADLVALITHDSADEHVDFTSLLHESLPGLRRRPRIPWMALSLPDHSVSAAGRDDGMPSPRGYGRPRRVRGARRERRRGAPADPG